MFYEDLDDSMLPTSFQDDLLPTQSSPSPSSSYTSVPRPVDWNEDMLPVRAIIDPESHLEITSLLQAQEVSANPLVMIDSGATAEFINHRLVEQLGLTPQKKTYPRPLYTVDGSKIKGGSVKNEVTITLKLGDHSERVTLDVVDIGRHDIILGIPWLNRHSPTIDWQEHRVTFASKFCSGHCIPVKTDVHGIAAAPTVAGKSREAHPSVTVEDEDEEPPVDSPAPRIAMINAAAFDLACKHSEDRGTIWVRDPLAAAATQSKSAKIAEEHQKPKQDVREIVPAEFHDFLDVFEKKAADKLPPRRPYDLTIDLLPGQSPPFKPR